jgi:hypothetical protein
MTAAFDAVSRAIAILVVAAVLLFGAGVAVADDVFSLTGNYTQNVPCKGDGSDPATAVVKISPQQIVSNVGVCDILDSKRDGDTTVVHVECKFPAGPLMGNVSFTPRPDQTIDFVDRDNNYKAVLHRCPE